MSKTEQELASLSLTDTADLIRTRRLSAVEVTEAMLSRIDERNPALNAFVTITPERAIEQAKQADAEIARGRYRGPLHGIPIVHKDIVYTRGIRTTASSKLLENFVPDTDATVATRLAEAGTVLLGKVQTHEFAAGATTDSPHFGPCRNPWDKERTPGGSSGGTGSAVAAGLAYMGTGTDTRGSIRIPAACCGVVGLKATYGRVSRHGIFPLAWSLDHAGPLTRTVKDAAVSLQAMAGRDPKDPSTTPLFVPDYSAYLREELKGVVIGIPTEFFFDNLEPGVSGAVQAAIAQLEALGASAVPIALPFLQHAHEASMTIAFAEAASIHDQWYDTRAADYGPDVRALIAGGRSLSAKNYLRAQRARQRIIRGILDAMAGFDAILAPTTPCVAPRFGDGTVSELARLTSFANLTGLPALSLPCGFADGMPVSLQIIGRPFDESGILGIGHAYERSTEWHRLSPA